MIKAVIFFPCENLTLTMTVWRNIERFEKKILCTDSCCNFESDLKHGGEEPITGQSISQYEGKETCSSVIPFGSLCTKKNPSTVGMRPHRVSSTIIPCWKEQEIVYQHIEPIMPLIRDQTMGSIAHLLPEKGKLDLQVYLIRLHCKLQITDVIQMVRLTVFFCLYR